MKHLVALRTRLEIELVISDDYARKCRQWSVTFWPQWNLPERVYLAALDGLRWLSGWIPRGEDWRGLVEGGEYWKLVW